MNTDRLLMADTGCLHCSQGTGMCGGSSPRSFAWPHSRLGTCAQKQIQTLWPVDMELCLPLAIDETFGRSLLQVRRAKYHCTLRLTIALCSMCAMFASTSAAAEQPITTRATHAGRAAKAIATAGRDTCARSRVALGSGFSETSKWQNCLSQNDDKQVRC